MPGRLPTFVPCVLFVFCDAVVDWFVVARLSLKTELWLPRILVFESMPVAALGFTYCSGLVCCAWLAPVRFRAWPLPLRPDVVPTFAPCVLPVFCEADVDWLVVARFVVNVELWSPSIAMPDEIPVAAFGFTD